MTKTDTAPEAAAPVDPIERMALALFGKDTTAAAKDARGQFSAIAGGQRPWEQLPSRLKSAARGDARRLTAKTADRQEALEAAGYSKPVAARLLRDIGRG